MIAILGCGALGSRIAIELYGENLLLIDNDRVGAENIPTAAYFSEQIGQTKVFALSELCYRRGITALPVHRTFDASHSLRQCDLAVDCFDNVAARRAASFVCIRDNVPLIHVGVSDERIGCIAWDRHWPMPTRDDGEENPICTHLLGREILSVTASLAANVVMGGAKALSSVMFVGPLGRL